MSLLLRIARRRRAAVLLYHGLSEERTHDPLLVPRAAFERQVDALRETGFRFVTVAEMGAELESDGAPSPGTVALTFDDGLRSVFEPLMTLAGESVPATVYPVTAWLGKLHPRVSAGADRAIMGRDELRALAKAGVEIGAHTASHRDLSTLGTEECSHELIENRCDLESMTGRPVETLAYPWGRASEDARRTVREAGFRAAVSDNLGAGWERFMITRIPVAPHDGSLRFALKLTGAWSRLAGMRR